MFTLFLICPAKVKTFFSGTKILNLSENKHLFYFSTFENIFQKLQF